MNSIRIFFYRYFVTYIIFYNNKLIYNNIQVTNCVTKCNKTIGIGRLGLFRIILNKISYTIKRLLISLVIYFKPFI